jgi:ATP-dependent DNA helicase RecQ
VTLAPDNRADELLGMLGFEHWRAGQKEAVEAALAGRDSLIVMPTGGGKSLCYQLPGLASEDLTIVVTPLIALMTDQWRRLRAGGHPVAMIASGMSDEAAREALGAVRGGEARIVYCSPERFGAPSFLAAVAERRVDLMAIDEAHCLSEWGHDFRPDYLRLPEVVERLGRPTVMACTATATTEVAREVVERLGLREPLMIRSGFDRPNLSFDVVALEGRGAKARKMALLEQGLAEAENRPAIVYCGTRRDTDEVTETLRATGLAAVPYHAGMAPQERTDAQRRFMTGEADVVVATNAFGMGVDKADVRSVWHLTIPTSVEAYYQEAGRAGRDGLPARAVLLAMRSDLGRLVRFNEQRSGDPDLAVAHERGWRAFRVVKSFVFSEACRRRRLLSHFGDTTAPRPEGRCCDVCDPEGWLPDPETIEVRPKRSSAKAVPPADLAPADEPLFLALRSWRKDAAAGKPAFTIAHDSTLRAIATTRPSTPERLLEIKGIGPSFIAKYADAVLGIVAGDSDAATIAA